MKNQTFAEIEHESITEDDNENDELRTYSRLNTNSSSSNNDENSENCANFEIKKYNRNRKLEQFKL